MSDITLKEYFTSRLAGVEKQIDKVEKVADSNTDKVNDIKVKLVRIEILIVLAILSPHLDKIGDFLRLLLSIK